MSLLVLHAFYIEVTLYLGITHHGNMQCKETYKT